MNRQQVIRRVVFVLLIIVLLASVPSSLRYAYEHGGFYMFSKQFLIDLPKRLNGPGRFRFVLQPAVAIFLGIRAGIADGHAGRLPYIFSLLSDGKRRWELLKEGFAQVATLVAMAILLDAISQWLILRAIYPGPALVVGPVLIAFPYSASRALANRYVRARKPAQTA
ncbi:MAG TPA: hypothetical protein VF772_14295 [Terriglobales bacterium]